MGKEAFPQLIDGQHLRMLTGPEHLEFSAPYYVIQFWELRGDDEGDYHSQWSEVVRGASDVLQALDVANQRLAEEPGPVTFALFVIAPDVSGKSEEIELIRLFGDIPNGRIEVQDVFGWAMYLDADASIEDFPGLIDPADPRETHLVRIMDRTQDPTRPPGN